MHLRSEIINTLIKKFSYKSYLEIGVHRTHHNFDRINALYKVGVDPDPESGATLIMTSDWFFSQNKDKFDIVFIDGLHHASQCYKDIESALRQMNTGGTILVHDCNPSSRKAQLAQQQNGNWNGDVWKAWVQLRSERKDLEMFVINTDEGVGLIRYKTNQPTLHLYGRVLSYTNLRRYRCEWLNLIEVVTFEKWLHESV